MSRKFLIASGFVVGLVAGAVYLLTGSETVDTKLLADHTDTDLVVLGRDVYASQCAACHSANLEGQPRWRTRKPNGRLPAPPHDASGHTWHHDDLSLFRLTKFGLSAVVGQPVETDMPAFEGVLSDREIWAVLAYIKSRWPENIRQRQADINARTRQK